MTMEWYSVFTNIKSISIFRQLSPTQHIAPTNHIINIVISHPELFNVHSQFLIALFLSIFLFPLLTLHSHSFNLSITWRSWNLFILIDSNGALVHLFSIYHFVMIQSSLKIIIEWLNGYMCELMECLAYLLTLFRYLGNFLFV